MKPIENYDKAEVMTGEREILPVGGYVCKILSAEIATSQKSGNEMLVINFDICEGEKAGYFKRRHDESMKSNTDVTKIIKWSGVYRQMIQGENAAGYFKGFMTTLSASNNGFDWDKCNWDESKLVGLIFGGLFGREEYIKQDGTTGMTTKIRYVRSAEKIRNGEYTIPADKLLKKDDGPFGNFTPVEDDDLPF